MVDCSRCGDFRVDRAVADDIPLPFLDPKQQALASYVIRKMTSAGRVLLTREFFESLAARQLPTPAEASDNLVNWLAEKADGRPGRVIRVDQNDFHLLAGVGVVDSGDVIWIMRSLKAQGLLNANDDLANLRGNLTAAGWRRFEELRRAHVDSSFAFFARQFKNPDLDRVFEECLRPAVAATGYELRPAPQQAGLIDAIIEDEIRRCRFLLADLSDDNAGAYWEAGFAQGLGKPVIYVCRESENGAPKKTHFDTDHRQTVRWDLASLDHTATRLKAVIRNTLLGDAKQTD